MGDIIRLNKNSELTLQDERETFSLDVLMGLSSTPKNIPPKYFYDARGSEIFCQIMDLPEYYPTRCEFEILRDHGEDISASVDVGSKPLNIIELGAGDGSKTRVLLESFLKQGRSVEYFPVDISSSAVEGLKTRLAESLPDLKVTGVVAEYLDAIRWINNEQNSQNLVLFLGSNIGNFSGPQARVFLKMLWNALDDGDRLLIGFDLKKDLHVLHAAYDDPRGITAEFNLNLLDRMNRELQANFDRQQFQHYASYDVKLGAMESWLVSKVQQSVDFKYMNKRFYFLPYEPIHVEYSFKFLPEEIELLAFETGYELRHRFSDQQRYFSDVIFEVRKEL